MAIEDRPPNCSICGNEMARLKRLGLKKDTVIFACAEGEPRKPPCDGKAAMYGSRFR